MKPAALCLLPILAACGTAAPSVPEVSVGTSPVEVKAAPASTEPAEDGAADDAITRRPHAEVVVSGDSVAVSMEDDGTVRITGTELAVTDEDGTALPSDALQAKEGLLLIDGDGHRFEVETIPTAASKPRSKQDTERRRPSRPHRCDHGF